MSCSVAEDLSALFEPSFSREGKKLTILYNLDFLLGVFDKYRMGALRFKTIPNEPFHTFFTKQLDRYNGERIHFASAMTMTGNNEDTIRDNTPSYLDIVDFIQNYGCAIDHNLNQL